MSNFDDFQIQKAIHELTKCCALARIVHGDSHWKHARAHVNLAEGYIDLKSMFFFLKNFFGLDFIVCFLSKCLFFCRIPYAL